MHQRLHNLSEGARRKNQLSGVQCFSIQEGRKEISQKVVWYLPITPRLQCYFVDPKEAKLMRWHPERKKPNDGDDLKLRHIMDGSQWRAFNDEYRYFACDARNIVLGACTDGMNPFGNQNNDTSPSYL